MVFQQRDGVFILYSGVLLSQHGVDPRTNSQLPFPSIAMCLCLVGWPVVKPLYVFELLIESLNQVALDGRVLPLELWWRVIDLPLPCGWWFIIPKPYLDFLLFEAPMSYRLSEPLQYRLPVWCILTNSLKVMALLHHTSLHHTMCSMTAPYHKYQHPSALQSGSRV
jgi:hypothetical protein